VKKDNEKNNNANDLFVISQLSYSLICNISRAMINIDTYIPEETRAERQDFLSKKYRIEFSHLARNSVTIENYSVAVNRTFAFKVIGSTRDRVYGHE